MFTTIKKLRDSSAAQGRVTVVHSKLKAQFDPNWSEDRAFPTAFVAVSNGMPDYEWVQTNDSVKVTAHIPGVTKELTALYGHRMKNKTEAAATVEALKLAVPTLFAPSVPKADIGAKTTPGVKTTPEGKVDVQPPTPKIPAPKKTQAAKKTLDFPNTRAEAKTLLETLGTLTFVSLTEVPGLPVAKGRQTFIVVI